MQSFHPKDNVSYSTQFFFYKKITIREGDTDVMLRVAARLLVVGLQVPEVSVDKKNTACDNTEFKNKILRPCQLYTD